MNCIKCKTELPNGALYCPMCGKKQTQERRKALKRANGTGTVYKLPERRKRPWVAAKNKVIIGYYEKKTDAMEALETLSGKKLTDRYNMTFEEVFNEWKKTHYIEIGKKGIESYDRAFDVFKSLHKKKFRALRAADYQEVINEHMSKSHSTVSKYKQLITQMSDWAVEEEIIQKSHARFVKIPKYEKKEKEIFSDEDIKKLETDGSETAKIVLMLIYTGMRIGELFYLPIKDYHKTYVIGGEKTEAGRNRIIPIRPEGRAYFEYFANIAKGDLILSGYSGQKNIANFRRRDYYPLLDRLGIPRKTPHSTRHTYASWARRINMQPEMLQKILGHASYTTTANTYVHKEIEEIIDAVETIDVTNRLLTDAKTKK